MKNNFKVMVPDLDIIDKKQAGSKLKEKLQIIKKIVKKQLDGGGTAIRAKAIKNRRIKTIKIIKQAPLSGNNDANLVSVVNREN